MFFCMGDDRHGSKYRVMEIFVSGRQDIALRLINPVLGSAYLLCGASPVFASRPNIEIVMRHAVLTKIKKN